MLAPSSMESAALVKELARCRKEVAKAKPSELQDGLLLARATDLGVAQLPPEAQLEQLSLLLSLFRQLRALSATTGDALLPKPVQDLVYGRIAPAFIPTGAIAALLLAHLDHPNKPNQLRAADVLGAAARFVGDLPIPNTSTSSHTNLLVPLFQAACQAGASRRANLVIINTLVDVVPAQAIPDGLLDSFLDFLGSSDSANLRSTITTSLLSKRRNSDSLDVDRTMLEPLLPYLDPSRNSPTVMVNLTRYVFPALFKSYPSSLSCLLNLLGDPGDGRDDLLPAWVPVASLGVSLGHVSVRDLPSSSLREAMTHQDPRVRLRAYELVTGCKDVVQLLDTDMIELAKGALCQNAVLPSSGCRTDFASATFAYFNRLAQATIAIQRAQRNSADASSPATECEQLRNLAKLRNWFLTDLVDGALQNVRRPPVVRSLLALNHLGVFLDTFGLDPSVKAAIFTEDRVALLLSCQASEFSEVRSRARSILASAPTPLPGYQDLSSPASQALLRSAFSAFATPRKTENEAATSALCILFEKLVLASDDSSHGGAVRFVDGVVNRLEDVLKRVETEFASGMEDVGLHGLVAAIRALVGCLDLTSETAQSNWKATFHRLHGIVLRVWSVTRAVVSLAPSGSTGQDAVAAGVPAHEIARAYEALAPMMDEDDDFGSVDPTRLISGCWRATKEASELLSTIATLPLTQAASNQTVWTKEDIDSIGRQYLQWLHEIRHRGTFSKVAISFAKLVEAVKRDSSLGDLIDAWLEHELLAITNDTLSTTRRSAALPFSVLSIVAADKVLLDRTVDKLIELGHVHNAQTSDTTKVHAFNILKIVLLDARQTKLLPRYFEQAVMTAVDAFASPNWNVRNVGLILFSTLVHRSLTPARVGQDMYASRLSLSSRQTFASWHSRYPRILPFVTDYLNAHRRTAGRDIVDNKHSPLFPILIIVRGLQYSEDGETVQDGLKSAVRPYLGSPEWQIRQVAAQALSSLISPVEAIKEASNIKLISTPGSNELHGNLLFLGYLFRSVIIAEDLTAESKSAIEAQLSECIDLQSQKPAHGPLVTHGLLWCIQGYTECAGPTSSVVQKALQLADRALARCSGVPRPGAGLAGAAAADLLLSQKPTTETALRLLNETSSEDDKLAVLARLSEWSEVDEDVLARVLELATGTTATMAEAVQVAALDALSGADVVVNWAEQGLVQTKHTLCATGVRRIGEVYERTRCTPLKEAALPALGWAVARVLGWAQNEPDVQQGLSWLADYLPIASHEDQSQPARLSAVYALRHLSPYLFPESQSQTSSALPPPTLLALHQTLHCLLQDDDESIRLVASDIVSRVSGLPRSTSQTRAVELWWAWTGSHVQATADKAWTAWMESLCLDETGYDPLAEDLESIQRHGASDGSDELFEVERPNLFRDTLEDASNASRLLARLHRPSGESVVLVAQAAHGRETEFDRALQGAVARNDGLPLSPIDDAWDAALRLPRRIRLMREAWAS